MSVDVAKQAFNAFETILDRSAGGIKPYLPMLARFLLCSTFLEDSLRIMILTGFSYFSTVFFLVFNIIVMISCSAFAVVKKHTGYAVSGLFLVVLSQCYGYNLLFNMSWVLRSISVTGGLLMLLADSLSTLKKRELFAPLLLASSRSGSISAPEKTSILQLLGRSLLVALFLSFMIAGEMTLARVFVALASFVGCIMVVVGFKAKWSAWILVLFLSVSNVLLNNWWNLHHDDPKRDFQKFDFFQTLSVMGGFLLLVNSGPGGTGETGKSTILKQLKLIHGIGFSNDERKTFRSAIVLNVVTCAKTLIKAMMILKIPYGFCPEKAQNQTTTTHQKPDIVLTVSSPESATNSQTEVKIDSHDSLLSTDQLTSFTGASKKIDPIALAARQEFRENGKIPDYAHIIESCDITFCFSSENAIPKEIADAIKCAWDDSGVKYCFSRANEFQLLDSCA
ncbi:hypothetical protein HDU82_004030 [Entophlyctis luteolus]|nr:hypothetical protein HDU82_004030 [Entophlyctis luteolus]